MFPRIFLPALLALFAFGFQTRGETPQTPPPVATGVNTQPELFDVSLGFNYLRVENAFAKNMYGFDLCLFLNLNSWLAFGGDFMGAWGQEDHVFFGRTLTFDESRTVYAGGVRVNIWHKNRVKVFAEALAGGAHGHVSTQFFGVTRSSSADGFAAVVGGGAEWKFARRFSWRILEADYVPAEFNSHWENDFRVATGLSYSFGSGW